jgi:DNA segregation ATPase FtsK/SpoIIIE, S-DNA-T family
MTGAPPMPDGRIQLQPPPRAPRHGGRPAALRTALFGTTTVALVVAVVALFADLSLVSRTTAAAVIFGILAALYLIYWCYPWLHRRLGRRARQSTAHRARYLRYLAELDEELRRAGLQQRRALLWRQPDPDRLAEVVADGSRVGERRPDVPLFLVCRLGLASQTLAVELVPPPTGPVDELDVGAAEALRELLARHAVVPDLPVALALADFDLILVSGDAAAGRGLVRALLAHVLVFHRPEDIAIDVTAAGPGWQWIERAPPGTGAFRIVVVDGDRPAPDGSVQIRLRATRPPRVTDHATLVLDVTPTRLVAFTVDGELEVGLPDVLSERDADELARRLPAAQ